MNLLAHVRTKRLEDHTVTLDHGLILEAVRNDTHPQVAPARKSARVPYMSRAFILDPQVTGLERRTQNLQDPVYDARRLCLLVHPRCQ